MTEAAQLPGSSATRGHGFGTAPVFFAGISTILGAIMFLRFGYAVGHVGMVGALLIVLLGHLVTIPTALALAEIATNRRVEGGGEYFIISRSFGTTIGSAIGLSLYLSQAFSVAFYMIAFAEAFTPLAGGFERLTGIAFDPRIVSLPATLGLLLLVLSRGANMGIRLLYGVVAILGIALVALFLGGPVEGYDPAASGITGAIADADPFILVFAICFPAFTGMTAGVGLSGDLANPRRSIPQGTIAATLVGMLVYVAIIWKLASSASPEQLASDQLIMSRIAIWGPIIPIGLASATLSSAIGSILVAPRSLQAIGKDRALPWGNISSWLSAGVGDANEPRNTTLVTGALAVVVVLVGDVNAVARLISMFFMVTYGSLCAISFLEHFAARPGYRPSFRSRWYISLFGAVICFLMMFQMDPVFALLAILVLASLYGIMTRFGDNRRNDLAAMFEGVMTQLNRNFHLRLQRRDNRRATDEWRPSIITVNERTFDVQAPLALMRWLCHRQGFGTHLHYIKGVLNEASFVESKEVRERLVQLARTQNSPVYMDTVVSPSMTSALAQSLQLPGISGLPNNTVLFEVSAHDDPDRISGVVDNALFAASTRMTLLVLRHGDYFFGDRRSIHVWLTWNDATNANMMILLGYILVGHPEWQRSEIRVFVALPSGEVDARRSELESSMKEGRLPVSEKNVRYLPVDSQKTFRNAISKMSRDADLTIVGFNLDGLRDRREEVFANLPSLRDVLFVHAPDEIRID